MSLTQSQQRISCPFDSTSKLAFESLPICPKKLEVFFGSYLSVVTTQLLLVININALTSFSTETSEYFLQNAGLTMLLAYTEGDRLLNIHRENPNLYVTLSHLLGDLLISLFYPGPMSLPHCASTKIKYIQLYGSCTHLCTQLYSLPSIVNSFPLRSWLTHFPT